MMRPVGLPSFDKIDSRLFDNLVARPPPDGGELRRRNKAEAQQTSGSFGEGKSLRKRRVGDAAG